MRLIIYKKEIPMTQNLPIAVIYDHREILNPLFPTLVSRGLEYTIQNPYDLSFGPASASTHAIVYNDVTAPAYQFKTAGSVQLTTEFIKHRENYERDQNTTIINGSRTTDLLFSKTRQLSFFNFHRLRIPNTVVTTARNIPSAAEKLQFPIVIKEVSNHSEALFVRIETADELIDKILSNFFTADEGLPVVLQEWVRVKDDRTIRVDLINGNIAHATGLRVSLHPDYNRPFLLNPHEVTLHKSVSEVINRIATDSGIELVTVEFGIDRDTNDPVFFGIHPHNLAYQASLTQETRLIEMTADYIQQRLATVRENYYCL